MLTREAEARGLGAGEAAALGDGRGPFTFFVPPTGLMSRGLGMRGTGGMASAERMGGRLGRVDPVDAERETARGGTAMGDNASRAAVFALRGGGLTG